jgi:hypothetical protein
MHRLWKFLDFDEEKNRNMRATMNSSFLFRPETYQLGTVKGLKNASKVRSLEEDAATTEKNYRKVILEIFTSKKNKYRLVFLMDRAARLGGEKKSLDELSRIVEREMEVFLSEVGVPTPVEHQATGLIDYVSVLEAMNSMMLKRGEKYFRNQMLPARGYVMGQFPRGKKKMTQLLASDYQHIRFAEPEKVYSLNLNFRENNRIPVERWSRHMRHVDRSNEGLAEGDPERASLETPVRVHRDLSQFVAAVNNWENSGLF